MNHVTLDSIKAKVKGVTYLVVPDTTTTICTIFLENGFTVNGESACVSPLNFNKAVGEEIAYEKALNEIWPLEGYLLKEKLYQESLTGENNAK